MVGNSITVGKAGLQVEPLQLSPTARARHTYVCGGTGVGKSKFLEHCVRQDIEQWSKTGCGLILFDPHGAVYKNIMAWLAYTHLKRPVVPIDLRRDDWIISYNLLRRRKEADPSVVVSNFVRALAHVWGAGGTDQTPLFARWATVILSTLYQNGYTIVDVMHLLSRHDIRRAMSAKVTDDVSKQAWLFAEKHPKEFEQQITSTLNRFQRLLGPQVMRATLGQLDVSLDLRAALEEGAIILVNLSTEGGRINEENTDTFATLLLTDLWAAAQARGKKDEGYRSKDIRPFYVYLDECQKFITPTIADNLDQARGFGLHLTLANQFPTQFLNAGPSGKAMYDSILANAGNKILFRLEHPSDIELLAKSLFMSSLDPDQVKLVLKSTKVMGYREETRQSETFGSTSGVSSSSGRGSGAFQGESAGEGEGGRGDADEEAAANWNRSVTASSGESSSWSEDESHSESTSHSITRTPVMVPIMGEEVSSVQYRSIDEQLFIAMQRLFAQQDRNFAIRYHGGPKAPVFVRTPTVTPPRIAPKYIEECRQRFLGQLPFALRMDEASKRLAAREAKLLVDLSPEDEPVSWKRRLT